MKAASGTRAKKSKSVDSWKRLADEVQSDGGDGGLFVPPDYLPDPGPDTLWEPNLNPTQKLIFNDPSMVVVAAGEKGSGKSIVLAHCDVRHCYENDDALCLILVTYITAGSEGIWHDLENFVLPAWRDGNRFPDWLDGKPHPRAGEYMDHGLGLHYTDTKLDPLTKDRHIWIATVNGAWSKIILKSIPHGTQVEGRIKGPAPSRIHVEEITNCDGNQYYTFPAAQLNRRRAIRGPQQFTASCNPDGPSHWVYKEIVSKAEDENGVKSEDVAVYHVPISENLKNLPPDYQKRLDLTLRDPYQRRRLIDGEWVDVPSGDAIFKDYFVPCLHIKGDALRGIGLLPLKGYPIIVGHDPGPKNYSIHFEQRIFTTQADRPIIWSIFDELNFVGQYKPYDVVARDLARRIRYWEDRMGFRFVYQHIADEAAFTQRNTRGTFDALEMQREAQKHGLRLKMLASPKGADTQPQRVQLLIDHLLYEQIIISARNEKTIDMLRLIVSKKLKEGEYDPYAGLRAAKSPHLHPLDSLTYPMWRYHVRPNSSAGTGEVEKPRMFWAGEGVSS